jgi:hypothetical protein
MIYCTVSVGDDLCKRYETSVNELAETETVYVLTDCPQYFPSCKIIEYNRDVFSYYEKIILLINLVTKYKERVTLVDIDALHLEEFKWIVNKQVDFDNESLYTFKVYTTPNDNIEKVIKDPSIGIFYKTFKEVVRKDIVDEIIYPHERILSMPYKQNHKKISSFILELQDKWESIYPKGFIWESSEIYYDESYKDYRPIDNPNWHPANKHSNNGCGYGEGGVLSYCNSLFNLKIKQIRLTNNLI